MPEPYFEQIAHRTLGDSFTNGRTADALAICDAFAEQLRQVWNARGAADRAALQQDDMREFAQSGRFGEIYIDEVLKALDR